MEMLVYISNLGKYNEGELTGEWFSPPIDMDGRSQRKNWIKWWIRRICHS